jgi:Zn-dependent membrane protease YugP
MSYLILVIIPFLIALYAQWKVHSTYTRWSKVRSEGRITGAEAASAVMRSAGIHDVTIVEVAGHLTDYYDPQKKQLALSSENYRGTTLAALGVAAHEAGHAIQHEQKYAPLNLRMALIPITNFSSQLLPVAMMGGFIFPALGYKLLLLGVIIYLVLTVFQLVTLPVEFDASTRAKAKLVSLNIVSKEELRGVIQTLDAAAFTYLAAFISSLGWLVYLASRVLDQRD